MASSRSAPVVWATGVETHAPSCGPAAASGLTKPSAGRFRRRHDWYEDGNDGIAALAGLGARCSSPTGSYQPEGSVEGEGQQPRQDGAFGEEAVVLGHQPREDGSAQTAGADGGTDGRCAHVHHR